MEKNESTSEISTILLTEIYQDYKKNKKRQRLYTYLSYGFFFFIIGYVIMAVSTVQSSFQNLHLEQKEVLPEKFMAAVTISGTLLEDSCDYNRVNELIERAFEYENSVGVLLDIDSPGGSVYDAMEIYNKIEQMKKEYPDKKVISYVRRVAASGGYLIACAADQIYTNNRYSNVGSIGVYVAGINVNKYLTEKNIDPLFVHSGNNKGGLSLLYPVNDGALKHTQQEVNEIHKDFIELVQIGRGERLKANADTYSGLSFMSAQALEQGLIDGYELALEKIIEEQVGDYPVEYVRPPKKKIDTVLEELVERYSAYAAQSFYRRLAQEQQTPLHVQAHA